MVPGRGRLGQDHSGKELAKGIIIRGRAPKLAKSAASKLHTNPDVTFISNKACSKYPFLVQTYIAKRPTRRARTEAGFPGRC